MDMKRITSLLVGMSLICWCVGCASGPEVEYYVLSCRNVPPVEASASLGGSVFVEPFTVADAYASPQVAYRSGPYRVYYDEYRQWAEPPERLIWSEFVECLLRRRAPCNPRRQDRLHHSGAPG